MMYIDRMFVGNVDTCSQVSATVTASSLDGATMLREAPVDADVTSRGGVAQWRRHRSRDSADESDACTMASEQLVFFCTLWLLC